MPIQLFIWRLSSKLLIAIPVHSVNYAATFSLNSIKRPIYNLKKKLLSVFKVYFSFNVMNIIAVNELSLNILGKN